MNETDNKPVKKILLINGHPYEESFCAALSKEYYRGACESDYEIKAVNLYELSFDPVLRWGYSKVMLLEKDLLEQQSLLKWCDHLVIVTPVWWAGLPAILKGYIDRVILPGFAFKYTSQNLWNRLLKGKSAHVIYTQGHPKLYSKFVIKDAFWNSLKNAVLSFCGFYPIKRTYFSEVPHSNENERKRWLNEVYMLGKKGK